MSKLHLRTQDNQPYGSVRLCCEMCGAYYRNESYTSETDDRVVYAADPNACDKVEKPPTLLLALAPK